MDPYCRRQRCLLVNLTHLPSFYIAGYEAYSINSVLNPSKCVNIEGAGTTSGTKCILYNRVDTANCKIYIKLPKSGSLEHAMLWKGRTEGASWEAKRNRYICLACPWYSTLIYKTSSFRAFAEKEGLNQFD